MELPSLSSPERLWWLVALLPVLYLLAQPPRPQKTLFTAHAAQWQRALQQLQRRPPRFRALRWLLLSLACIVLAMASAGPVQAGTAGVERVVFLVDGSMSMGARAGSGTTAFLRAVECVRALGSSIPAHVEVETVVARSGSIERLGGPFARAWTNPGEPVGALPASLAELANACAREGTLVYVFGDGQPGRGAAPEGVRFVALGESAANAALVKVEVVDGWPLASLVVRATLRSFSDRPMRGTIAWRGSATPASGSAASSEVALEPGASKTIEFACERDVNGGSIQVQCALDGDALAADDVAEIVFGPLPRTQIAVQAEGDDATFAKAAGKALADAVGGAVVDAKPGMSVGFLLVDGGTGSLPKDPGPALTFGLARKESQPWPSPLIVDWDRSDPIFEGVDLSELEIAQALAETLPAGRVLMTGQLPDGSSAPLCVLEDGARGRAVHFAFRLQDSNLGLLAAFPQILLRCFERTQLQGRSLAVRSQVTDPAESDLSKLSGGAAVQAAPVWSTPPRDLAAWFAIAALLLLALRSGLR